MGFHHVPVLLAEVLTYLAPRQGGRYMDGTVGGAGHSAAILKEAGAQAHLIGFDQDPRALAAAEQRLQPYGGQVTLVHENFRRLRQVAEQLDVVGKVDGILLDLGVSSHQLDEVDRGFMYRMDAPLDMRMNPQGALTAAQIVNTYPSPSRNPMEPSMVSVETVFFPN
ncbi:16S rRNA (cytosine(1402)-N(4))-methyltransferase RsmH [Heliophilum fasciatum]|uniref:16S rRNA (Cytosine(1402)-N(4))-methyltransferase n=1 Tax=Heliophilum fasciatum TaxID=35700 RepID=A0A4R2RGG6_9FIRM|nr:16S rRNA (cytosine(1402)-N(4))-methyltransferase RsmH [Heliophilum fasciatum]MCW2279092.1 16S rRNA (cytosine(1402)-N(4))-methyltransferase [Heliophilum fasciatum]TCP61489.1 16S rRNA (cytosine(1402)-N(4))-methyltransferase [Heliophilum fasciatum]